MGQKGEIMIGNLMKVIVVLFLVGAVIYIALKLAGNINV